MLETRDLVKIYKPKKGVPVTALDKVSIKFPDKGMVFLLGKSGSGKSTLLNVLGGLDNYNNGEIFIKGVSSKSFKQSHFDSYRNTYVGFIFQEYNILDEFSVGANIALAIELQGRKATDDELNKILDEVDLSGYGARNPNELSGGQKQRVAIARALVKNPKIIMADEPSGALDSTTGKQVFDTLKKLSKEKLVIVVSHDRDFASLYADRIIELADGKVISDVTLQTISEVQNENGVVFEGNTAKIPMGYHLTEEDRIAINEYMEKLQSGGEIEFTQKQQENKFLPTDQSKIKNEDNSPFRLIKSKLAMKHAFKIGSSGLKYKKFRLVMTVLLSCIAFTLFGLVDTFSAYDHITATADSLHDSGIRYASVSKSIKHGSGDYAYWDSYGNKITEDEIKQLSEATGVEFKGVLENNGGEFSFESNVGKFDDLDFYYDSISHITAFHGMVEINQNDIDKKDYELVGRVPDGSKNEIAISEYVLSSFKRNGYRKTFSVSTDGNIKISSAEDIIGKKLRINGIDYEIVGVVDTKLDMERYESIFEIDLSTDATDLIRNYVLEAELRSAISNDYTGMMMVGDGYIQQYRKMNLNAVDINNKSVSFSDEDIYFEARSIARFASLDESKIIWVGSEKEQLSDNEIIISQRMLEDYLRFNVDSNSEDIDKEKIAKLNLEFYCYDYNNSRDEDRIISESGYKIVGYIKDSAENNIVVLSDNNFQRVMGDKKDGYDLVLGTMPDNKGDIKKLAKYCYTERDGERYALNNPASFELDALDEGAEIIASVLFYVGLGFAIFASILLSNFIATSISYKKQEIGILRAIGSRGNDVFRIFFAEAFIIAMINFVLACIGTGFVTAAINSAMRNDAGLLITVLHFGLRQILVIFIVSLLVAAISCFLPVKKIASKRPIDAIKSV